MNSVSLVVLTSPGCTHCHAFLKFWEEVKSDFPSVALREVSILEPEGQQLAMDHQIFSAPGIFLNGELFASGGFHREEFLTKMHELTKS
ncbi:MAG: thioredoxin family protein [Candidatus Sungbacteria bacterium]|nr:thioredoxin family protein [Candidatus Sungbacteria bacterium]